MPTSLVLFLVADAIFLIAGILLVVAAFRVRVLYGFLVIFLPFAALAFAIKHPKEGAARFVVSVLGYAAMLFILATDSDLRVRYGLGKKLPGAMLVAEAFGSKDNSPATTNRRPSEDDPQKPREARDLADSESSNPPPAVPRPVADLHAAERAALAKHSAALNALYAELNKERATLKKGSPAVAAFNAKAAKYQEGLGALAAEQSQLNALDHPAAAAASLAQSAPPTAAGSGSNPKEAEANAALARLRAAAASADYAAFVETLRTCLVNYRQTAAFPQIAATARTTLANATPEKLAAAIQAQGAAAHSEEESTMSKVRLIVNQTPPRVPTPPRGAETYHYGFHPGALTPDYAHADLVSTRELWKGEYVYMDTVPNVFYRSADCEFNPQTKFFFTSRDVPKKKLTDAEIAEVVRLYRVIAADERMLAAQPQRLHDAQAASAELLALNKQLAESSR